MSSIFDMETITDFCASRGNWTFGHQQGLKSGKHQEKKGFITVSALKMLALSDNEER